LNRKQEKRFWSADQKRFVYSLRVWYNTRPLNNI
jgi:hypothetical protein